MELSQSNTIDAEVINKVVVPIVDFNALESKLHGAFNNLMCGTNRLISSKLFDLSLPFYEDTNEYTNLLSTGLHNAKIHLGIRPEDKTVGSYYNIDKGLCGDYSCLCSRYIKYVYPLFRRWFDLCIRYRTEVVSDGTTREQFLCKVLAEAFKLPESFGVCGSVRLINKTLTPLVGIRREQAYQIVCCAIREGCSRSFLNLKLIDDCVSFIETVHPVSDYNGEDFQFDGKVLTDMYFDLIKHLYKKLPKKYKNSLSIT